MAWIRITKKMLELAKAVFEHCGVEAEYLESDNGTFIANLRGGCVPDYDGQIECVVYRLENGYDLGFICPEVVGRIQDDIEQGAAK